MKWSNYLSRLFGRIANYPFPRIVQNALNSLYVRYFKIDMSEFDTLDSYPTLNALFTRSLIRNRPFDAEQKALISPCDSLIMARGKSIDGKALQIKGMEYPVSELLGEELEQSYEYVNFYLSPKDYHRFHAPCDLLVLECRYFSGVLLPVNTPSLRKNARLFVRNERVVLKCRDEWGETLYFVAVGALNVGQMALYFEPRIKTNVKAGNAVYRYDSPIKLKKAQEIGLFKMGSTILLFTQNWNFSPKEGARVHYGDAIATKESE